MPPAKSNVAHAQIHRLAAWFALHCRRVARPSLSHFTLSRFHFSWRAKPFGPTRDATPHRTHHALRHEHRKLLTFRLGCLALMVDAEHSALRFRRLAWSRNDMDWLGTWLMMRTFFHSEIVSHFYCYEYIVPISNLIWAKNTPFEFDENWVEFLVGWQKIDHPKCIHFMGTISGLACFCVCHQQRMAQISRKHILYIYSIDSYIKDKTIRRGHWRHASAFRSQSFLKIYSAIYMISAKAVAFFCT